ncbi:MAG: radical SAM protein [Phycisphaeraceae bacterium]|nr:radical SAM protein [Phycisphaeraceae bacterium]
MPLDLARHPCFNADARHHFGRVHLPVAPACNVQCNFCNRKYDCANESRPGVTSVVLSPEQALEYLNQIAAGNPRLSVVGIAGPGDPMANPDQTMSTLRLVRTQYPDMLLCLATNGLNLSPFVPELAELKISHVTLTVNAVDPLVSEKIYAWIRDGRRPLRGLDAALLLFDRQVEAIKALKAHGIAVKINTILIPGVNDHHVADVAEFTATLGADIFNLIPLLPVQDTPFAHLTPPPSAQVADLRRQAGAFLPQMSHCARCRADAAGLLAESTPPATLTLLRQIAQGPLKPREVRPYVAVASQEGVLVNQHLGEASEWWIFGPAADANTPPDAASAPATFALIDRRPAPSPGGGANRWLELGRTLKDCRALLCSGAGENPRTVLSQMGVRVIMTETLIEEALTNLYQGQEIRIPVRQFKCGPGSCSGSATGCG